MKKRYGILLLALATLAVAVSVGVGVYAYMVKSSDTVTNELIPGQVDCQVVETFDGEKKTSITVKNTGNVEAYIRVRLVTYWVTSEGSIAPKASEMPTFTCNSTWFKGSNDTYYYTAPVNPGEFTADLLPTGATIQLKQDGEYYQVVEVFAEAIQSLPAAAVEGVWPVQVNGTNYTLSPREETP